MKPTCKECRRFKHCMESSREYPCKDFAKKEVHIRKAEHGEETFARNG